MVLAPVGAQAVSPWSPSLTRAPYLTDLVGTHVNVNWATNKSATTGSLHWGPVTAGTCTLTQTQSATRSSITVGTVHEYQWKTSLALPGQGAYCYRPLLATTDLLGTGASPQFLTQVAPGDSTPFSFDVFGDWGQVDGNGNSIDQSNLFAQIAASGARFAVTVGDNGYPNGNQQNYGDLQQHGQDTSAIFGPSFWTVAGSSIPLFTAAGNHGLSGSTHTDLTTWTENNAVSLSRGRYQADTYCCVNGTTSSNYASEWYAFDAGPARFYDLDSAWGDSNPGSASVYANDAAAHFAPGTPEYQWLLNDLQSHPTALKFAFSHYPFYADNPDQPSDTSLEGVNGLEGLLGTYGVKIAFNGHAHVYERNTPSAPGMPITYVTGGGGGVLEPIGPCHSYDAYGVGWSPTKSKGTACGSATIPTTAGQVFHFLKVTVSGTTVTVAPTDENGNTFDVQTYTFSNLPDTVIDSAPPASSKLSSAAFTFHATAAGATFACSLDGAPATTCTSPASYSSIADGAHSFSVAATTTNGTDPTPAVAQWTVDSSPPTTPANLSASATSATVVSLSWAAASDNVGVAGYDVQRNGVVVGSTTAPTTTYVDTTVSPSTTYSYAVVARDAAGNVSAPSAPGNVTTPAGSNSPTLVQGAGSSTATVTLPGTSAAGDLLVLTASVSTGASKPITAVTDGKNTWQKAGMYTFAGQNSDGEIWYAANAAPVQSITVTTTAAVALQVREFNGVAPSSPLDGAAGTAATSKSANSGVATPTPGDLAIGFIAGHANTQAITGLTPGFTIGAQQVTSVIPTVTVVTGFATLPTAAPQGFSGSFANAMYWSAGVAFFKPVSVAPTNDFAITASPVSVTATAGQSITSSLSTNVTSGNAQTVTFSATGAPAGASVSFTPASLTAGQSSTLSITTTSATPAGTYSIAVTGTGASATHTTTVQLTVNATPIDDFAVTASPNALTVTAGQSALTTIGTSTTSGNAQTVGLTATGAPAGTTLSFTPTSVTSGQSSTLTITTTAATPAGTYSITVTGSGPSLTHTATVTLAVTVTGSSPHLVQAAGATESAPATSLTAILPAPTTAGDLLVVSASVYTGATNNLVSVSDAAGHLFTKIGAWSSAGHNSDGELWYLPNAASTTSVTVKLNLGASAAIEVQEFAGIAATSPLDVATGTSSTSTTASSGSITPATSGELVVGLVAGHANAEVIAVNSAGFTVQPQQNSTGPITTLEVGYMFVTAPSSITFGASFTTVMYWAAGLAAFKAGP
ncbi:MAG TPA: metallophosphoesterase [Acidothermaceae bacterium]